MSKVKIYFNEKWYEYDEKEFYVELHYDVVDEKLISLFNNRASSIKSFRALSNVISRNDNKNTAIKIRLAELTIEEIYAKEKEIDQYLKEEGIELDWYKPTTPKNKDEVSRVKSQHETKGKQGCYIATAVYGDYDAPSVMVLRRFRDNILKKYLLGRIFIRIYYAISPTLAKHLHYKTNVNTLLKKALDKLVSFLENKEKDNYS